jgi:hypothetical protein
MEIKSSLDRSKTVLASYKNGVGQIVAWCNKRAKLIFGVVSVLAVLYLIQHIELTGGRSKNFGRQILLMGKTTLSVWQKDEIIAENLPSLPYVTWKANKNRRWNLQCGQYPYIFDVTFFNTYWQTFKLQNYTVQTFGKDIKLGLVSNPIFPTSVDRKVFE